MGKKRSLQPKTSKADSHELFVPEARDRKLNQHEHGYRNSEVVQAYLNLGGNAQATADALGLSRSTVRSHVKRAGLEGHKPIAEGQLSPTKIEQIDLPRGKAVRRWILTSAQNNTKVNKKVWAALTALAKYYKAEILCASYSYNTNAYGPMAVKNKTFKGIEQKLWYDPLVLPLLEKSDQNMELAPGLIWCGRMNTIPTAVRPLSGFETYTGRKSGIFPHAKLSMESVASGKAEATKFNYTTGTITQINYIQKKAGLRAEHHHSYGGLLVEVDSAGRWFVRQLVSDQVGTIYDLNVMVKDGEVIVGTPIEAITWGDVHVAQLDPRVRDMAWATGGMLDVLKPKYQFMHDLLDFRSRNHHDRRDPHKQFQLAMYGEDKVAQEVERVAQFLQESSRSWCKTVVVDSNHDNALLRWLKDTDWRTDPVNAKFYLSAQLYVIGQIEAAESHHVVEWAVQQSDPQCDAQFLRQDESFVICRSQDEGIECGMHGHLGPNGVKGTPLALSKMGRRANIGHSHSACIIDGVYVAGVSGSLDMGYNVGPSSWSHSHIVTYPNGSRAIVTMWDGKWRA
jgi:hypothetical protein